MVLSLLSGQGLIDGSVFLPLPSILSLALHKVLLFVEKNPTERKPSLLLWTETREGLAVM